MIDMIRNRHKLRQSWQETTNRSRRRLYHVISRGKNRRKIFRYNDDFLRFAAILHHQKARLPFYLNAYCLMPNHLHLLIEMQNDPLSRIMSPPVRSTVSAER